MGRDGKILTWRVCAAVFAITLVAGPAYYLLMVALKGAVLWQTGRLAGDLAPAVAAFVEDSLLEGFSAIGLVDCLRLFVGAPILFFCLSMIEDLMADARAARKGRGGHDEGDAGIERGRNARVDGKGGSLSGRPGEEEGNGEERH